MQVEDDIIKTREAIKRKYLDVKRGKAERNIFLEKVFDPITKPLNELVNKKDPKRSKINIKVVRDEDKAEDIATPYLDLFSKNTRLLDKDYGLTRDDIDGSWKMGMKKVFIDRNDIVVDGEKFHGTKGLWELLTKKSPVSYDKKDLDEYKKILLLTSGHKKNFDPNASIRRTRAFKYTKIIQDLFQGGGFKKFKKYTDFVWFDDLNELCDRLKLLISSQAAGNNGHQNEILSIIEELREANVIQ